MIILVIFSHIPNLSTTLQATPFPQACANCRPRWAGRGWWWRPTGAQESEPCLHLPRPSRTAGSHCLLRSAAQVPFEGGGFPRLKRPAEPRESTYGTGQSGCHAVCVLQREREGTGSPWEPTTEELRASYWGGGADSAGLRLILPPPPLPVRRGRAFLIKVKGRITSLYNL